MRVSSVHIITSLRYTILNVLYSCSLDNEATSSKCLTPMYMLHIWSLTNSTQLVTSVLVQNILLGNWFDSEHILTFVKFVT